MTGEFVPQPSPLWCAENSLEDTWGGRVIGWLSAEGDYTAIALVARVDDDGATRATYRRPLGAGEVWLGDTREDAFSAARRAAGWDSVGDSLDAAMYAVWLEGQWEWVTRKMTNAQREAAAAAVIRHHERTETQEPIDPSSVRWWAR
ncbi:hypothetical protein D7147_04135 [Micromonospora musae]|uniref:Uncharacterized protein n=1 Tax=Micromonospora musae TaxID=1894970 RepID=A0ABX9RKA1_9ACTN|nr:hypothetical protein [Micromonospora musae]RKN24181.1 hypothetical protein D7147_04135 [Micromonospora musae]